MENKSVANNRQELFENIVRTYLDALHSHGVRIYDFENPAEHLSGLAMLLYLIKHDCLIKAINMPDGKDAVVLTLSPSVVAGDMENWIANKIGSKGLLRTTPIENEAVASLYDKYRNFLRTRNNAHALIATYDAIREVQLSDADCVELLEVAERLVAQRYSKVSAEFTNPTSLSQLVWNMLSQKPRTVLDPFMGGASFATPLPKDVKFIGWDIQPSIVEYAQLKLALSGREFACECVDCIEKICGEKYDAIVTCPPFGVKRQDGLDIFEYAFRLFENNSATTGEMVIVAPSMLCFSAGRYASLRKEFTEKNYLDKIIALPSGYFYGTAISCSVIHLKKTRNADDPIQVYNFGEGAIDLGRGRRDIDPTIEHIVDGCVVEDMRCVSVSMDDIREQDYSWNVLSYPEKHAIGGYYGGIYVPFSSVVTRFRPEVCRSTEHADELLNIRNVNHYLDKLDTYSTKQGRYVAVTEPVLVVGYKASCPLVAIEASETTPVYLSDREIIYRCLDNISPKFLANLFSDNFYEQSYFAIGSWNDINRNIDTWLQRIDVSIIPLAEQLVIVEDAYRANLRKQAEDSHMLEYIEEIKEQYTQEVRSRKHNMRPYLREMKSSNDLAQLILKKASSIEEVQEKLLPLLLKMEQNRKGLSEIVDHLSQIDKYGEPEIVEIDKILHERFLYHKRQTEAEIKFCSHIPSVGYCEETGEIFRLEKPELGHFVKICPYDLRRMVDCIIDNARVHGFEGKDAGHHIEIDLSCDETEEMVEIRFTNDGKPFPEGFDINRYGLLGEKAGPHAGTGDGGHQVVSIAKHFHGYVTLESTKADNPESCVSIVIHLPAYHQEEWDNEQQGRIDLIDPIVSITKTKV